VTQGPLGKGLIPRACCLAPGECRLVGKCDEILFCRETILGLNSEEASSSPKDDSLDEVNEVILLAFSDELFFSTFGTADSPALYFTVRHQTSSVGSLQALRRSEGKPNQAELSIQLRDVMLSIRRHGWRWGYLLAFGESWFCLSTGQITR
jgi:hypothetical protein